jgi:hypothetical protein
MSDDDRVGLMLLRRIRAACAGEHDRAIRHLVKSLAVAELRRDGAIVVDLTERSDDGWQA